MNEKIKAIQRIVGRDPDQTIQPSSILTVGEVGHGKTWSLRTLLPYGRVVILDLDRQARKLADDIQAENLDIYDFSVQDSDFTSAYQELDDLTLALTREDPPFAIVLESGTSLRELCVNHVLQMTGHAVGTPTSLPHYDWAKQWMQKILYKFMAMRCVRIINCHIEWIKNDVTGMVATQPNLPGKMAQALPGKCRNVLLAEASGPRTDKKWNFITIPDDKLGARTERILPPIIPQDYGIILGLKKQGEVIFKR